MLFFYVICVFWRLVVLVRLSVPVQVIDWKDSSPKLPVMGTLNPTHSLTHSPSVTGGSRGNHCSHPVCQWDLPLPQPAMNFPLADGHFAIYGTYLANIHVRLLNMWSRVYRSQNGQKCVGDRGYIPDRGGELKAVPRPLRGKQGQKERKGGGRGDEGWERDGKEIGRGKGGKAERRGWRKVCPLASVASGD